MFRKGRTIGPFHPEILSGKGQQEDLGGKQDHGRDQHGKYLLPIRVGGKDLQRLTEDEKYFSAVIPGHGAQHTHSAQTRAHDADDPCHLGQNFKYLKGFLNRLQCFWYSSVSMRPADGRGSLHGYNTEKSPLHIVFFCREMCPFYSLLSPASLHGRAYFARHAKTAPPFPRKTALSGTI